LKSKRVPRGERAAFWTWKGYSKKGLINQEQGGRPNRRNGASSARVRKKEKGGKSHTVKTGWNGQKTKRDNLRDKRNKLRKVGGVAYKQKRASGKKRPRQDGRPGKLTRRQCRGWSKADARGNGTQRKKVQRK